MKEARFELSAGRTLAWYQIGQGRPLLLLHGWCMSAAVFSEIAELLAADFCLLIPDLPGHGRSSPAVRNDLSGIAADLARWLNSVAPAPVGVVGWSLGGMLALELAHQPASPVEQLVLIATTPRFTLSNDWPNGLPGAQVRALARNLARRFEATLGDFFTLALAGDDLPRERLRAIRNFAVKSSPLPERSAALGLLEVLAEQDQRDILTSIEQPALVLHGAMDQIVPLAAGRYLSTRLPHGEFATLSGHSHAPFLSQPQSAIAQIRGCF